MYIPAHNHQFSPLFYITCPFLQLVQFYFEIEADVSAETFVPISQISWPYVPENCYLHIHCYHNFQCHIFGFHLLKYNMIKLGLNTKLLASFVYTQSKQGG